MSTALVEPELLDVPDDYELVDGKLIECKPMSFYAGVVANNLQTELILNTTTRNLGRSYIEMYFRVPTRRDPTKIRRPDLVFVTNAKWPVDMPLALTGNAMDMLPDLAVEVVSPTDDAEDVLLKMRDYLRAGITSVWIIYPTLAEIHCYSDTKREARVFGLGDTLAGDPVLPGFEIAVDKLFPPVIPESIPEPPDDE